MNLCEGKTGQKRGFVVHGTLVKGGGKGFLLLGDSGSGKTSLAVSSESFGYSIVADDAVFIRIVDEVALGYPTGWTGEGVQITTLVRMDGEPSSEVLDRVLGGIRNPLEELSSLEFQCHIEAR